MASVDDRIVRMEFDNAAFERNANTTLSTLSNLEKAMKFENVGKGLADVSAMSDKLNLGTLSTSIDGISTKFLAMSTIAITALSNIANKAVDVGMSIVKSLALDGIMGGFKEYELKLGSIQTIMAGSGASLDEVNKKLNELNTYSDRTIYSFKDMTSNIGKFTNAGLSLDTSVASIQGVANVAAVSGANSEEASRAMYNFAQALSKGSVALIDWKSIELANMGTVEFKQQLIDAGVAQGTLTKQGDQYITTAGHALTATKGFNDTLTDQWLTTEVLTKTLGDYADETTAIGKKAFAAAQDIKTFSQLMDTTKEAIGSGWAQSFEILIGNFDEAKKLWSGLGSSIGKFVNDSAASRNTLLQTWKDFGGRNLLIESITTAFKNLGEILKPIKDAFREIFPPTTAQDLFHLTYLFSKFADALKPSTETVDKLHHIFKGLFSILSIGWTVIKEGIKFIGDLVKTVASLGGGSFLTALAKVGDFFTGLQSALVKGEGIKHFFEVLGDVIKIPIALIGDLGDKVAQFFGSTKDIAEKAAGTDPFGRVKDRVQSLSDVFDKITSLWEPVKNFLGKMKDIFDGVMGAIGKVLGDFAEQLGKAFASGNFNKVLDALNVGLFGGLLLLMNKFLNKGIKINATIQGFFGGGLFEKVGKSFDALTGTLGAMQSKLKAEALMKIAIAIGVLTVSVVALSLIDSAALTKALTAMAVGFGQLMASFAILEKISATPKTAATFGIVAAGMILMGGALLILSGAMAVLGRMSWTEIVSGLTAISALIVIMGVSAKLLASVSTDMIAAGVGLTAMGVGLGVLAIALKIMSTMDMIEMGKGFVGIAAGLLIMAGAMRLMPKNMVLQSVGLVAISASLVILGVAMKIMATMSWGEIGKGLAAIAGGLFIIGVAVSEMPATLPLIGAGLVLVSAALIGIGLAMKIMATMSWAEIARGLGAMAGALFILAVALESMSGAIVGAIALGIITPALMALALVIKAFAAVSFDDLIHGLIGIAAVLAVLGLTAYALQPAVGAMMALGVALVLLGAGFALFGTGVAAVAKGLAIFISLGPQAATALVDMLKAIGKALPALFLGAAEGVVEFIGVIKDNAPAIVDALVVILGKLLDGLEKLVPKVLKILAKLIDGIINYLYIDGIPRLIEGILSLIGALLTGIRDHIDDVVVLVGEIIIAFVDALANEVPKVIDSVANLFISIMLGVSEAVGRVSSTIMFGMGIAFIDGFMQGLTSAASSGPMKWFTELVGNVIGWVGDTVSSLYDKGIGFITGLFSGITEKTQDIITFFTDLPLHILEWIGDTASSLMDKGLGFITGLLTGINNKIGEITTFFTGLAGKVSGWLGDTLKSLYNAGMDIITGLFNGIHDAWDTSIGWFRGIPEYLKNGIINPLEILKQVGIDIMQGLWNGLRSLWDKVWNWVNDQISGIPGMIKHIMGIGSPSKVMMGIGKDIIGGLVWAFEHDHTVEATTKDFTTKMNESMKLIMDNIQSEYKPVITPVVNFDPAAEELRRNMQIAISKNSDLVYQINKMQRSDTPLTSEQYANAIASIAKTGYANTQEDPWEKMMKAVQAQFASGITYQQNIYAPTQLSTSDIYKQTRNQITMAKEELSIP